MFKKIQSFITNFFTMIGVIFLLFALFIVFCFIAFYAWITGDEFIFDEDDYYFH